MIKMPDLFNTDPERIKKIIEEREKIKKINEMRNVGRLNPDGSESTVIMASGEIDGKYYAWPTLFPKDPNNYTSDPNDWVEMSGEGYGKWDSFDEALRRGETFLFDTEEEAALFALGSWKPVQKIESKRPAGVFLHKAMVG